ncbi:type II toxin-antitoxin system Phd/YefM family antitoxin [Agromyces aerolatus]|uniref:type II toxin-antitoxin system Phd/YefM family antitoxin n=1 Tax=Agromyces sp. LY-1074 TaxID=3074080 RepID=UPI00285814CC|nr:MULTISPECIES: type II toxin-antitoxin system Phd/YefM family antitoxin [unclassified Agromyces]MDR5700599.1 type II toxin-antitoxin system Phd/YefM family antitoxin [Agromyces sp. LY-1074]MDR5707120.1 type II toxin-antitoxin system Phd/YefM family antitoxin [Agromyces sp. LY-1358]
MQTVPLSEAKDKLSGLIERVEREHEIVEITRHGRAAAVLISKDALDSLYETMFWLSQPGVREDVAEARRQAESGETLSAADVRARYGLRPL